MEYSDLPASPEYLEKFIGLFKSPIEKGQSVSLFSLPLCGKTGFFNYFLRESEKVSQKTAEFRKKFIFVYIDLLATDKLDLIERETKIQLGTEDIKDEINRLTFKKGQKIVLVIDSAERLLELPATVTNFFYNTYKQNPMAINFLFLFGKEVTLKEAQQGLAGLLTSFSQNQVYLPLTSIEDLLVGIVNQEERNKVKIDNELKLKLAEICGGWGGLMRVLLRRLMNNDKEVRQWLINSEQQETINAVLSDKEIIGYFRLLYESFSWETKDFLTKLFSGKIPKNKTDQLIPDYLRETKCLLPDPQSKFGYKLFCYWVEKYMIGRIKIESPPLQEKAGKLFWDNQDIEEILSPSETAVFRLLWEKKNKLVSRDEIAQKMWGEDWTERYSDWAVDKTIARIRKKLRDTGIKRLIRVVKGKGLRLKTEKET